MFSGAVAGITSTIIIYPLEITRTRLALSKDKSVYKGIADCMHKIYKYEGFKALYKGMSASIYGIIPYASVNLTLYNIFKDKLTKNIEKKPTTV